MGISEVQLRAATALIQDVPEILHDVTFGKFCITHSGKGLLIRDTTNVSASWRLTKVDGYVRCAPNETALIGYSNILCVAQFTKLGSLDEIRAARKWLYVQSQR